MNRRLFTALMAACVCSKALADLPPSATSQGALPAVNDQTKAFMRSNIQASPKPAMASASVSAPPSNLPAPLYKTGNTAANNFDNQHAYHEQIKQYLKTHNRPQ